MTKRLYVQNVDDWNSKLAVNRFSDRKLEVKVVEHGIVLPARRKSKDISDGYEGGVCDSDFNFIAGYTRTEPSKVSSGKKNWCTVESAYIVSRKKLVVLDEDVIFGGALMGHFGHFIMEGWSRLWYVIQNPELKSKILFITTTKGGYKPWFDDFFRLMGIDNERIIYVKTPTQCRSVTIPEQSQYASGMFTKEFLVPYQAIKSRVDIQSGGVLKNYT